MPPSNILPLYSILWGFTPFTLLTSLYCLFKPIYLSIFIFLVWILLACGIQVLLDPLIYCNHMHIHIYLRSYPSPLATPLPCLILSPHLLIYSSWFSFELLLPSLSIPIYHIYFFSLSSLGKSLSSLPCHCCHYSSSPSLSFLEISITYIVGGGGVTKAFVTLHFIYFFIYFNLHTLYTPLSSKFFWFKRSGTWTWIL